MECDGWFFGVYGEVYSLGVCIVYFGYFVDCCWIVLLCVWWWSSGVDCFVVIFECVFVFVYVVGLIIGLFERVV